MHQQVEDRSHAGAAVREVAGLDQRVLTIDPPLIGVRELDGLQ
ncbi:MAG: hypothetical protein VX427_11800 [Acidobacteriota bacterium]|nr:hypothetical protein [Acidobacteriota bacterium]